MPSPLIHTAAGVAAAHLAGRARWIRVGPAWTVGLAILANAPDLDFIPDVLWRISNWWHHGPTHTLVAAGLAGVIGGACAHIAGARYPNRVGVLIALVYLSHIVLDFMVIQDQPASPMTLLWPFSDALFHPPIQIFLPIHHDARRSFAASLWQWDNLRALVREILIAAGVWLGVRVYLTKQFVK